MASAPPDEYKQKHPHLGFKFWIQIDGVNVAGFTECSPITIETEVFEYSEGGLNTHTHKLPVRAKYANITLKHGLDPGQDLQKWFMNSMDGSSQARKNITIQIFGQESGEVVKSYNILQAYPVKWTGADLRSDPAAAAIETLELAHNGLQPGGNASASPGGGGAAGGAGGNGESPGGGGGGAAAGGGGAGQSSQQRLQNALGQFQQSKGDGGPAGAAAPGESAAAGESPSAGAAAGGAGSASGAAQSRSGIPVAFEDDPGAGPAAGAASSTSAGEAVAGAGAAGGAAGSPAAGEAAGGAGAAGAAEGAAGSGPAAGEAAGGSASAGEAAGGAGEG